MNSSVIPGVVIGIIRSSVLAAVVTLCSAAQGDQNSAGQRTFSSTCAACHGLDGRGGEHAPNIATEARIQQMTDGALRHIVEKGIPGAGMPPFASSLNSQQIGDVISYLRQLQGRTEPVHLSGNAARGEEIFFNHGECSTCHMARGRGGFLGADLSDYGSSHSVLDTREAILNPNKNPATRGDTVTVITRAQRKYRGVLRNEDNFSLQMQTIDGRFLMLDKSDLTHIDHESVSLMPANYGSKLTRTEISDLLAFLFQRSQN